MKLLPFKIVEKASKPVISVKVKGEEAAALVAEWGLGVVGE